MQFQVVFTPNASLANQRQPRGGPPTFSHFSRLSHSSELHSKRKLLSPKGHHQIKMNIVQVPLLSAPNKSAAEGLWVRQRIELATIAN